MKTLEEMRRQLGTILVAMGLMLIFSFFIQAAMQGNAHFGGVLLIGPIPIIFGSSPQMALASILLGMVLMAISFLLIRRQNWSNDEGDSRGDERPESHAKMKGGAVVMIGPLPLVVGSDPRTTLLVMLFALAVMILWARIIRGC